MQQLKLSEAIRLGAMLKPQAVGELLSHDGVRTCAIGAAMDASGLLTNETEDGRAAVAKWPLLARSFVACPACASHDRFAHQDHDDIYDNITALNDSHGWTRERIADWVATIESAEQQQAQPDPVVAERSER